ncbi:hypothetical protein Tsubulata_009337 [Turnera subulata]|uniref:Uncharacterized protein n=1 Tax=Turnera subulata TaxID=218843 RepID=A0A9Q0JNB8_9ROSI|nr:hypothetical protein Tsubulata_009337 [Turnera subulata]
MGFQSATNVDPSIFLKQDDLCLLINGNPLQAFASVNFSYAWDPPFLLLPNNSMIPILWFRLRHPPKDSINRSGDGGGGSGRFFALGHCPLCLDACNIAFLSIFISLQVVWSSEELLNLAQKLTPQAQLGKTRSILESSDIRTWQATLASP